MNYFPTDYDIKNYDLVFNQTRKVYIPKNSKDCLPVIKILKLNTNNNISLGVYQSFTQDSQELFSSEYLTYSHHDKSIIETIGDFAYLVTFEDYSIKHQSNLINDDVLLIPLHKSKESQSEIDKAITECDILKECVSVFLDQYKLYYLKYSYILDLEGWFNVYFYCDFTDDCNTPKIVVTNSATKHYFHVNSSTHPTAIRNSMNHANHLCKLIGKTSIFE